MLVVISTCNKQNGFRQVPACLSLLGHFITNPRMLIRWRAVFVLQLQPSYLHWYTTQEV